MTRRNTHLRHSAITIATLCLLLVLPSLALVTGVAVQPAAASGVAITTLSLPNGTVDSPYPGLPLQATGGTPYPPPDSAYLFSVVSGSLPAGLSITNGSHLGGTPTAAGTFNFTLRATDSLDVFGDQAYTVVIDPAPDTTPPVIDAHGDESAEATSSAGAVVTYTAPSWTDDVDGNGTASCSPTSGSTFPLGTTTVTCGAEDLVGNVATMTTFNVTVSDTTAPSIDAHADETVAATSSAGAVVTYTAPSWSDAVDGTGTASCLPASGSTFAAGDTTVTCTATDAAGNTSISEFTVHVSDATELLSALVSAVDDSTVLSEARQRSLLASLEAAEDSFAAGDLTSGCNQLEAFINKVEAREGRDISADLAAELIAAAEEVMAAAGCP